MGAAAGTLGCMTSESSSVRGDAGLPGELLPLVYDQLRAIARERMGEERAGHTLQSTALVHEAFARLQGAGVRWESKGAFFAAAAEAMRRVLIDHARKRGAGKRGGGERVLQGIGGVADLASEENLEEIVTLDAAIVRLGEEDSEAAAIVRLRFYAGLSVDETAEALDISPRTVDRGWKFARAWLWRAME